MTSGGTGGNIIMIVLGVLSIYPYIFYLKDISSIKKASFEDERFY